MPVRPTYDGFSKASLFDPEDCRDRTDVLFREETEVVDDRAAFNGHESWAGTVAVGVLNEEGDVLLVNAPQGWTLPASPVKSGDDWAAVARRWVAQKTGRAIDIGGVERVARTSYRLAGSATRQTTGYRVVFRARPADRETPMDYLQAKREAERSEASGGASGETASRAAGGSEAAEGTSGETASRAAGGSEAAEGASGETASRAAEAANGEVSSRAAADWAHDWFDAVPEGVAEDGFRGDVEWFVGE